MKKSIITLLLITTFVITSCTSTAPVLKSVAYKGMYDEKPLVALIMPPINRSTNIDAKEYFHSTIYTPIADAGYYVIPPFLSMEIMKKESAFDAELFINSPLNKFSEVFGADIAIFTIIHKWDKSSIGSYVSVEIEYIIKSTKTNEVLYTRRGEVDYNTTVSSQGGLLLNMALTAINTAATSYIDVARITNLYTFKDLPSGKYSPNYRTDGEKLAGLKVFKVALNSGYN